MLFILICHWFGVRVNDLSLLIYLLLLGLRRNTNFMLRNYVLGRGCLSLVFLPTTFLSVGRLVPLTRGVIFIITTSNYTLTPLRLRLLGLLVVVVMVIVIGIHWFILVVRCPLLPSTGLHFAN